MQAYPVTGGEEAAPGEAGCFAYVSGAEGLISEVRALVNRVVVLVVAYGVFLMGSGFPDGKGSVGSLDGAERTAGGCIRVGTGADDAGRLFTSCRQGGADEDDI